MRVRYFRRRLAECRREEAGFGLLEVMIAVVIMMIGILAYAGVSESTSNSASILRARDLAVSLNNQVLSTSQAFGCGMGTGAEAYFSINSSSRVGTGKPCGTALGMEVITQTPSTRSRALGGHATNETVYNPTYEPSTGAFTATNSQTCVPTGATITTVDQQTTTSAFSAAGKQEAHTTYSLAAVPTDSPLYHLPVTAQGGIAIDYGRTTGGLSAGGYKTDPIGYDLATESTLLQQQSATAPIAATPLKRAADASGCAVFPFLPLGVSSTQPTQWTITGKWGSLAVSLNPAGTTPLVSVVGGSCSATTVAKVGTWPATQVVCSGTFGPIGGRSYSAQVAITAWGAAAA